MSFAGHPWEVIDATPTKLLSQAPGVIGTLEGDVEIDWSDDGAGTSRFTVDNDLANQGKKYRCSIHTSTMVGDLGFQP